MTSIWYSLAAYTQQTIQGLNLPLDAARTLPPEMVYLRRLVIDRDVTTPCIIVAPFGAEQQLEGDNRNLEVVYPVIVGILVASNQDYDLRDLDLTWRELIQNAMSEFPVPSSQQLGLDGVNISRCELIPQEVTDLEAWRERNLTAGSLLFHYHTNRYRKGVKSARAKTTDQQSR